jgi:amino acid transporter
LVALILAIVGATSVSNPSQIESNTEVHAAIILFLIVYIMIVAMALFAVCCTRQIPDEERILLKAVILALPFIFVKILYSLLSAFSGLSVFNFVTGSKTADLCMAVLEEMVVVLLYLFAGIRVQTAPVYEDVPPSSPPRDGRQRDDSNGGQRNFNDGVRNFTSGRRGILMGAINAAANAADKNSRRH